MGDLPVSVPMVQECPQAYEVFGSASAITNLVKLAKDKGWQVTPVHIENGDVSRFTTFAIPSKNTSTPAPFSLVKNWGVISAIRAQGGYTVVSIAKPEGLDCTKPAWLNSTAEVSKTFFLEVSGAGVQKMKLDAQSLGLDFKQFSQSEASSVFKFELPSGLTDYKLQSIFYRLDRGDYGEAVFGIGMSRSEMKTRAETKLKSRP